MKSVFQIRFQAIWRSWIGWVFSTVLFLATGISAYYYNFKSGSTSLSSVLSILTELLVVLIPALTYFVLTRTKRNGEERWLATFPISRPAYLLGSFLSIAATLLIASVPAGLLPLLLSAFGKISYGAAYSAWFGYFLYGLALVAIASCIASLFKHPAASIGFGIAFCAVIELSVLWTGLMESAKGISLLFVALLFALIGLFVWMQNRKHLLIAALIFAVPSLAGVILLFVFPKFLTVWLPRILRFLSPFARLSGFFNRHFDIPSSAFLVSVIVLAFCLMMISTGLGKKKLRGALKMAGVLAIVVGITVGLTCLPYRVAHPDAAEQTEYRLSDASKHALSTLDGEVTIRYFSVGGVESVDPDMYSLTLQYVEAAPNVKVKLVDPMTDSQFKDLDDDTKAYLDQSIGITGKSSRLIFRPDMFYYLYYATVSDDYTVPIPYTPIQYQQLLLQLQNNTQSLYAVMSATERYLALESMLTNAVITAANETVPRISVIGDSLDAFLEDELLQNGFLLSGASQEDLPENADAVLYNLSSDLTEAGAGVLRSYLSEGGRALVIVTPSASMPNLVSVLNEYGLSDATEPNLSSEGSVVGSYGLTTDLEKENGSRLVFVGMTVTSQYNAFSSGGDFAYILRAMGWLTDYSPSKVVIEDSLLQAEYLTPSTSQTAFCGVLLIGLLPLATVGIGAVSIYSRKKKHQ